MYRFRADNIKLPNKIYTSQPSPKLANIYMMGEDTCVSILKYRKDIKSHMWEILSNIDFPYFHCRFPYEVEDMKADPEYWNSICDNFAGWNPDAEGNSYTAALLDYTYYHLENLTAQELLKLYNNAGKIQAFIESTGDYEYVFNGYVYPRGYDDYPEDFMVVAEIDKPEEYDEFVWKNIYNTEVAVFDKVNNIDLQMRIE